jgi:hypothetical protein
MSEPVHRPPGRHPGERGSVRALGLGFYWDGASPALSRGARSNPSGNRKHRRSVILAMVVAQRSVFGACVVSAALLCAGCSSSSSKRSVPTTTSIPPRVSSAKVLRIDNVPNPEGPLGHFSATLSPKAFAVAVHALPSRLPPSSPPQPACGLGGTVVLTLSDGTSRHYGPCSKPASILKAMNALYATFRHPRPGG